MSSFWRPAFRVQYRLLAWLDPLIRILWRRNLLGITVELQVARRTREGIRSRLVGLLHAGDQQYVGHPNGDVGWTRDLAASGEATIYWPNGHMAHVRATRLAPSIERTRAIRATTQQPFPGNLIYRIARPHVQCVGVYFRLEPV